LKLSATLILVMLIASTAPPLVFGQRAGGGGRTGGGSGRTGGSVPAPSTQPATGPAQPGTPGSAYRPRPGINPSGPRGIRAARGLPFLWWWGYADVPDVLEIPDREEALPLPPTQPLPPPESSLIQPIPLLQRPQPATTGRGNLRLEVAPDTAQVYVDGFYVGTVDEISPREQGLDESAGWHRLEFRAPGYLTPAVNVTVEADRTLTYRAQLQPFVR
jgi:PEGA domain-containing protein